MPPLMHFKRPLLAISLLLMVVVTPVCYAQKNEGALLYPLPFTEDFSAKNSNISVVSVSGQPFDKAFRFLPFGKTTLVLE